MPYSDQEVLHIIHETTVPLAKALRTLADNVRGTKEGRDQAGKNAKIVEDFNEQSAKLINANQLTETKSLAMGMGKGGSSSSSDQGNRDK